MGGTFVKALFYLPDPRSSVLPKERYPLAEPFISIARLLQNDAKWCSYGIAGEWMSRLTDPF